MSLAEERAPATPAGGTLQRGAIVALTFLDGDGQVATGSRDGAIVLWDLEAGNATRRIDAHAGPLNAIVWDARRGRLISGGHDRRILVIDPRGGAGAEFARCEGGVFALAISPDAEVLASG